MSAPDKISRNSGDQVAKASVVEPRKATLSQSPLPSIVSQSMRCSFLCDKEVARRYGVSRATVWRWTKEGRGFPCPVKLSRGTTRWRLEDLEAFDRDLDTPVATQGSFT